MTSKRYKELLEAASKSRLEKVVLQTGRVNPEGYRKRHPNWRVFTTTDKFYELIVGGARRCYRGGEGEEDAEVEEQGQSTRGIHS